MERGKLFLFSRFFVRLYIGRWTVDAAPPAEPTVYVCSHSNLLGPLATLCWLPVPARPWTFHMFLDRENCAEYGFTVIDYAQRDSSAFRLSWQYMPQFRILDKMDFVKTMAVFLILFVFIAVVCFAAVFVIAYTRCMTIALTNRKVYDDLRHLGASNAYLRRSVRGQVKRVFLVPALAGTGLIYGFYVMIMYFNGSPAGITYSEAAGLLAVLAVRNPPGTTSHGRLTRSAPSCASP